MFYYLTQTHFNRCFLKSTKMLETHEKCLGSQQSSSEKPPRCTGSRAQRHLAPISQVVQQLIFTTQWNDKKQNILFEIVYQNMSETHDNIMIWMIVLVSLFVLFFLCTRYNHIKVYVDRQLPIFSSCPWKVRNLIGKWSTLRGHGLLLFDQPPQYQHHFAGWQPITFESHRHLTLTSISITHGD